MNPRHLTEVSNESGLWAEVPSTISRADSSSEEGSAGAPISWLPRLSLWRRVARGINVPAAVGIVAFVIALAVTAWIMVQGMVGESNEALTSSLGETQGQMPGETPGALLDSPSGDNGADVAGESRIVLVHVVGEVEQPGVVEISSDARVLDAITAAGGATDLAELTSINLARTVTDGEQIIVPDAAMALEIAAKGVGSLGSVNGGSVDAGNGSNPGSVVNINTASLVQLTQLPKIGPAIAQRIIDWREQHGGFGSVDQLLEISGIGVKTLDGFRDRVSV